MSIANSPLVKTAIAGKDANWGLVVMAVGKAGQPADRDKLSIAFNGIRVATRGARDPAYDETEVSEAMKRPKIQIKVSRWARQGPGSRADLRPHQGICRDQRRLSFVTNNRGRRRRHPRIANPALVGDMRRHQRVVEHGLQ